MISSRRRGAASAARRSTRRWPAASPRCASTTTLQLPDSFAVRISRPRFEQMDKSPFELGAEVEIKFASPDGGALTSI